MPVQLGDYVRFRTGHAPEAMKGRERDLGVVVALDRGFGTEAGAVVQFDGYRSAALAPGLLEVVGETWPARDDPEMAN